MACYEFVEASGFIERDPAGCTGLFFSYQPTIDKLDLWLSQQIAANPESATLAVDDPAVNALLGSIIAILVLGWLFRQVLNQIFNRN